MKYALMFIAGVVLCFLVDIHVAYSQSWYDNLYPVRMEFDLNKERGAMIAEYTGGELSDFENRWLPLSIEDPDRGVTAQLKIWITKWSSVCAPPCNITVYFITKDVNWITK